MSSSISSELLGVIFRISVSSKGKISLSSGLPGNMIRSRNRRNFQHLYAGRVYKHIQSRLSIFMIFFPFLSNFGFFISDHLICSGGTGADRFEDLLPRPPLTDAPVTDAYDSDHQNPGNVNFRRLSPEPDSLPPARGGRPGSRAPEVTVTRNRSWHSIQAGSETVPTMPVPENMSHDSYR